jgi:hypothetical protein
MLALAAGMVTASPGCAGITQLHQTLSLATSLIEICRVKPALKPGFHSWPLTVQNRKPGRVAVTAPDHRCLPEHPFKAETKPVCRLL